MASGPDVPDWETWCALDEAQRLEITAEWQVLDGDGRALAERAAGELASRLASTAGPVEPTPAWGCWMLAFRTPLIFDRAALPRTSSEDRQIRTFLGFPLRPWIAREDWPLDQTLEPTEHDQAMRTIIVERLDEFRRGFGEPSLDIEETFRRFHGDGFWVAKR